MSENKDIPTLRFPGFKGEWELKKLEKAYGNISSGRSKKVKDGSYHLYGSTGIIGYSLTADYNGEKILVARVGANAGSLYKVTGEYGVSDNTLLISEGKNYSLNYLYHKLLSYNLNRLIFGSGQPLITGGQLKGLLLSFPTLPEQQKIASFLTSVDTKIQQLTRRKSLLEQYKKGVMQQIFSQEIRFKDEDGNNYPDWEERKLGEVLTNKSKKYNPSVDSNNEKCIELEHIEPETGRLIGYVNSLEQSSIKNTFKKSDVLFGKLRPYLRKYLIAPFDGVCSTEIWVLTGTGIGNKFLYQLIQTNKFIALTDVSTGSKMPRADWNIISSAVFKLPCLSEQTQIANFLSAIDDKIELIKKQLENTQQFKKGLLQQMFV